MASSNQPVDAVAAAAALGKPAPGVHAKTFKWASQGKSPPGISIPKTMRCKTVACQCVRKPGVLQQQDLRGRAGAGHVLEEISPTQVRFNLRKDVKFSDGTPFTADDAVFSLNRAMAKTSNFTPYIQGIDKVVKVDNHTIDVIPQRPQPMLLRQMTELRMMSKAWAERTSPWTPRT